jgi:hypothetical protein
LSNESFRERYERLTNEELWRVVEVRKDLVPEAILALDREVLRRHLKPSEAPFVTGDSRVYGAVVALIILPFLILLLHFGRRQLVYSVLCSAVAISFSIWSWWDLRRHFWFWITIGCFALLHVVLILLFPWQSGWVPASVLTFLCIVDIGVIYGVIGFLKKLHNTELNEESSS